MIMRGIFLFLFSLVVSEPLPEAFDVLHPPTWSERFRPTFHLTTPTGWGNDPNGMVFDGEKYHMFYQHSPYAAVWAPMHWRHATSVDLFHWIDHGVALRPIPNPMEPKHMVFSGSAFIVRGDTVYGKNPMILMYTDHTDESEYADGDKVIRYNRESQAIAYATSESEYLEVHQDPAASPPSGIEVIGNGPLNGEWHVDSENKTVYSNFEHDQRDPKIFYDEKSGSHYVVAANWDRVTFFKSESEALNGKFTFTGSFGAFDGFDYGRKVRVHTPTSIAYSNDEVNEQTWGVMGGVWECPDMIYFKESNKWVLIVSIGAHGDGLAGPNGGSATQYFVGDFVDDGVFKPQSKKPSLTKWIDYGPDNYAGVSYSNLDPPVFQAWMSNWLYATVVPTWPWRSGMTLARTMELKQIGATDDEWFVLQAFKDLDTIREGGSVALGSEALVVKQAGFEIKFEATVDLNVVAKYYIRFSNEVGAFVDVGVDVQAGGKQEFYVDRIMDAPFNRYFDEMKHNVAPRIQNKETTIKIHAIFDTASVEILGDTGEIGLTALFFPFSGPLNRISIHGSGATGTLQYLRSSIVRSVGNCRIIALSIAMLAPLLAAL